jgi:Sulfotransferase family
MDPAPARPLLCTLPIHAARIRPMSQAPVFLLSLPRSGSTLLQRMLAAHDEVSTAPEPWILLPQIYAFRETGAFAEYGQVPASRAIREFAQRLPNGEDDYFDELRAFILRLYAKASAGSGSYFLDKTPRYYFIVDDLFRLFPDGKFVFLWRNPLAVVASIVETWGHGKWNLERWRHDLFDGARNLVAGCEDHADRAYALRFEDLVSDPDGSLAPLFAYLGLPHDPAVTSDFSAVRLDARMGDHAGSSRYAALSTEPLDKWKGVISTTVRKRWCRAYLRTIGERRLRVMGYDLATLLAELDDAPTGLRHLGSDLVQPSVSRAAQAGRETAARMLWRRGPPKTRDD